MPISKKPIQKLKVERPVIHAWRVSNNELAKARAHVTIDLDKVEDLLPWLAPGAATTGWRSYVGPVNDKAPDLSRIYYELALTISQFGGFIERRPDGSAEMWKHQGSGVRALLATMSAIRNAKLLPGIDVHDAYREKLSCFFMGSTFARHRTDMMVEIAEKAGIEFFRKHLAAARKQDGSYCFTALHMVGLAQCLPLSFGGDAPFYKKASLLLMTMEIALNDLSITARSMTPPPADYRIPQILEGVGILHLETHLKEKVARRYLFAHDDPEVRAIRTATVEAVGHIRSAYEAHYQKRTGFAELDGKLYLLSRNADLLARKSMHPHLLVATPSF